MKERLPFDDYQLEEQDFEEFIRRGRAEQEWEFRYENRQHFKPKER